MIKDDSSYFRRNISGYFSTVAGCSKDQITGGKGKITKVLKISLPVALVVALVLGLTLPGLAASNEAASRTEGKPGVRLLRGGVISAAKNQKSFTIRAGERDIEIEVNGGTKYFELTVPEKLREWLQNRKIQAEARVEVSGAKRTPAIAPDLLPPGLDKAKIEQLLENLEWLRRFAQEASFKDINVGSKIVLLVVPKDDKPLAKLVLIIKPVTYKRVVGTITKINESDKTITIEPTAGTENKKITLHYDNRTIFVLRGIPKLEEKMKAVAIYVETDSGPLANRVMAGEQ